MKVFVPKKLYEGLKEMVDEEHLTVDAVALDLLQRALRRELAKEPSALDKMYKHLEKAVAETS